MEGGEKKLKKKKLDCYRYILCLLPAVLIILAMVMPSAFAAASTQPQITSVEADRSGTVSTGTTVRWTCQAEGSGPLEYAWYVYRDGERVHVQWYRSQEYLEYRLDQPGTYHVKVFARTLEDIRSGGTDSASLLVEPPKILSVQVDQSGSLYTGTTVRWTCQAEGSGPLEYAWYVYRDGERVHVQWYRSQEYLEYRLDQPGTYHVKVFARTLEDIRSGGTDSASLLVEPPSPPQVISVEADRSGTVSTGTTVRWTCQAEGPGALEYAWYLYRDGERVHVQWYRSQEYLEYRLDQPGTYHVKVFARTLADIRSGGTDSASLLAEPPSPPQVISVEADRSGTVLTGTKVCWTCTAEGSGPLEYAWYLYRDGVRVDTAWYRSGNTFSYTLSKPGSYHVCAFARVMPGDVRSSGKISAPLVVEGNELIEYTQYSLTLDEALDRQMSASPPPQTDKYRNQPAYVHSQVLSGVARQGTVAYDGVRIRTSPWLEDKYIYKTVNKGTAVVILGEVQGALTGGTDIWYQVRYDGKTLYIHSPLVNVSSSVGTVGGSGAHVREKAKLNAHIYATARSGEKLTILGEVTGDTWSGSNKWYQVSFGTWRNAKREEVRYNLDPNNNDRFQHLVLTTSAGVSAAQLNSLLSGKGILQGRGQDFIDAGQTHAINEVYLVSHALLETGNGTSVLAKGVEVGKNSKGELVMVTPANRSSLTAIKKVYNMFGIGATDGKETKGGAFYAYNKGWDTPRKAIIGGAEFVGKGYIHNGQDTLYKMRWNPANPGHHQYATDMEWAVKQLAIIKQFYSQLKNPVLHFDIPVYKK